MAREEELRAALAQAQRRSTSAPPGKSGPHRRKPSLPPRPRPRPRPAALFSLACRHALAHTARPRLPCLAAVADQLAAVRSQLDEALADRAALSSELAAAKATAGGDLAALRSELASAREESARLSAALDEAHRRVREAEDAAKQAAGAVAGADGDQARYCPAQLLNSRAAYGACAAPLPPPPAHPAPAPVSEPRPVAEACHAPLLAFPLLFLLCTCLTRVIQCGTTTAGPQASHDALKKNLEQTRAMLVDALAQKRRLNVRSPLSSPLICSLISASRFHSWGACFSQTCAQTRRAPLLLSVPLRQRSPSFRFYLFAQARRL